MRPHQCLVGSFPAQDTSTQVESYQDREKFF